MYHMSLQAAGAAIPNAVAPGGSLPTGGSAQAAVGFMIHRNANMTPPLGAEPPVCLRTAPDGAQNRRELRLERILT